MKLELEEQRDYELQPGEVVVGRGLDEALKIKEYETNKKRGKKSNQDGSMAPKFGEDNDLGLNS